MAKASRELEVFIDQMIKQAKAKDYVPTGFLQMRYRDGLCQTVEAISKLVKSSEIQSGLLRLQKIGLLDMSLEAAVLKFPSEFTTEVKEYAKFRLKEVESNEQ